MGYSGRFFFFEKIKKRHVLLNNFLENANLVLEEALGNGGGIAEKFMESKKNLGKRFRGTSEQFLK